MTTLAAFQMGLQLLPLVKTGVSEFVKWLNTLKRELQRTGEWTPEMDKQFEDAVLASAASAAAQPDAAAEG